MGKMSVTTKKLVSTVSFRSAEVERHTTSRSCPCPWRHSRPRASVALRLTLPGLPNATHADMEPVAVD